jgi:hypothetical protein
VAHSAATASTTPILRFNVSILRNDRPSPFEVQAHGHDRVGTIYGVGQLAVRCERIACTDIPAKIVVTIFDLAEQVVGQRVCDTATGGQAVPVIRELIYAEYRVSVGMTQIAKRPATGEEHQQAVNGETASRTKRAAPAKVARVVRAERKVVIALDVGPEPIGFDTDQIVAALRIVADLAAEE